MQRLRCVHCLFSAGPSCSTGVFLLRKVVSSTQSKIKHSFKIPPFKKTKTNKQTKHEPKFFRWKYFFLVFKNFSTTCGKTQIHLTSVWAAENGFNFYFLISKERAELPSVFSLSKLSDTCHKYHACLNTECLKFLFIFNSLNYQKYDTCFFFF